MINAINLRVIEKALVKKLLTLDKMYFEYKANVNTSINNSVLFLLSQGYSVGGHTRLMENLSAMLAVQPSLLIARETQANIVDKLK